MQYLEVSCAVRRLFKSLGFKGLNNDARSNSHQGIRILQIQEDVARERCGKLA